MGLEGQMQDKNLQLTGELGMLGDSVSILATKMESLEARLQKIMSNTPMTSPEDEKQERESLCDMADQVNKSRRTIQKVNRMLLYIEENLQL